jgi:predicted Ser/Thr protein kinase
MPAGALAGLCPACLLAQGVETEPAETRARVRFEPPKLAEISRLFPQLEVLELLGAGGMGAVYKARQPALDRLVALKVLPAGGGLGSTERFNREARALARLSHPNIVGVHEFGQVEGLHFFIMEFVDGANLRQLEKTARLAPREALQIIPQICDALQYAHDEGVVHRDIKPENVLVDRKGRVKIADFGLAKIADPDPAAARLTVEGQVMGTPHYMAPEQVERPLAVDHRADIYALGVVFYEMLTGDLPLGKFAPPSRKVQVDVRLDEIVLRALENDPERRYQQASEVKSQVENVTNHPASAAAATADRTNAASEEPLDPRIPTDRCLGWLGVALQVERAGKWHLRWSGIWALFGIMLGLLTLLAAFIPAAGAGPMGSVFGLAGFCIRMILALGVTTLGVWRSSRTGPTGEHVPRNSVIMPSARRAWQRVGTGVHWALWVLVWLIFQTHWIVPWFKGKLETAQVARINPATRTLAVTLTNGTTIELLGLALGDGAPNQWWRPDGTPLSSAAIDIRGPADMLGNDRMRTKFAFKVTGSTWAMETATYEFEPSAGVSAGGEVWQNGEQVDGGWPLIAAWTHVTNRATLRFGLRFDTWRNIAVFTPNEPKRTETSTVSGDPKWIARLNHYGDDGTNTLVTAVLNRELKNWRMRVVAVDADGLEHAYSHAINTPADHTETWTCTFSNLTMDRIEKFQVQVQPVHWVEFRNVPLSPNGRLPEAPKSVLEVADQSSALTFSPVREISFDELLDLDTGRTGSFPINPPGAAEGNPLAGIDSNIAWMQEQGFDLEARTGTIGLLGVRVIILRPDAWSTMSPGDLVARLRTEGRMPSTLQPGPGGPVVGFATREGGTGMFRPVGFSEQPLHFQFEIKSIAQ